eukprot:CAMPEP_0170571268 /NCGR_PEP_ID=MMETSP0224-20130122/1580_1 /TAXON_ID=285029 /ORGANISM="Togula jolla, Strain CCCM 725" /LENGTH=197 /DNA_ID=CAMNT_0010893655 /DNA_START=15 /DNA_END=605 /DNA_ORIENTATION=+
MAAKGASSVPVYTYVCKSVLESLRRKVAAGESVTSADVLALTAVDEAADSEELMPVDIRERLDRSAEAVRRAATHPEVDAASYIRAAELFAANPEGRPERDRPVAMTAQVWREKAIDSCSGDESASDGDEEEEESEAAGEGAEEEEDEPDGAPSAVPVAATRRLSPAPLAEVAVQEDAQTAPVRVRPSPSRSDRGSP